MTDKDIQKIEGLLDLFVEHWNQKDAAKMASVFTSDAEFTDIMGQIATGVADIEFMHKMVFQHVMKHAVLTQKVLHIRPVAENHYMATCKWQTSGHTNPEGVKLPDRTGLMVVIVRFEKETLAISLVQNFDFTTMYSQAENYSMKPFSKQFPSKP